MAKNRDQENDEAGILQNLIDQGTAPVAPDSQDADAKDSEGEEITENADGSATITSSTAKTSSKKFYRNLAEELDPNELQLIGTSILKLIENDKKARQLRDEQYEEGLKRMGMSKDTIGGANFTGSSIVAHPMYTQACIDFEARAIKELLPAAGPAREFVPGTVTTERTDKARRKAKWFNYLFLQRMPGFRSDFEQLLMQLPMSGDQYIKLLPPTGRFKITHEWVPVDKMLLPEAASSFYTAERRTHIQDLTALEVGNRVRSKFYRNVKAAVSSNMGDDETGTETAVAKIEGKERTGENVDNVRIVYECDCIFDIPVEDNPEMAGDVDGAPYLISIDPDNQEILAIYRNWAEGDKDQERLEWIADFGFVPFRGAYHIGLPHIIGGLSIAATGALRALLDSAHINNLPSLVKLKGAAGTGQNLTMEATGVSEIEGTTEVDDIRKLLMAVPYNPPSPTLFQLLGFLDNKGTEVIRTTLDESNDNANMPVGTQMMRIEQGMIVFSAIHGRLHSGMDKILKIMHRLCATYLEDADVMRELGEQLVKKSDFEGANDVLPSSDPNIFCELQRYAQVQTVAQRSATVPGVYDPRKVEELILKQMRLPNDGKDLLISKPEATQLNPVNENVALVMGRPIVAFPEQDHDAHIMAHVNFVTNPMYAAISGQTPPQMSAIIQHMKEHMAFWYAMTVHRIASDHATAAALTLDPKAQPVDIGTLPQSNPQDPQIGALYDQMLAAASVQALNKAKSDPGMMQATQMIQKFQQAMQQAQPPQPMDPGAAAAAETARKSAKDQADNANQSQETQIKSQQVQQQGQQSQAETAAKLQQTNVQAQAAEKRQDMGDATKIMTTNADNQTAIDITNAKIDSGEGTASDVKDGEAVGKGSPKT